MRSFFDFLTRTALRFRLITLALVVVVMVLGGVSATQLNQELLPPIEFPQVFIIAPVSGMTADQALHVVTERIEAALLEVPEIVNVESQTTAQFVFLTASYEFGLNPERLRAKLDDAINSVYFPSRVLTAPEGQDSQAFAQSLMADLSGEVVMYLADKNPSFIFQLAPSTWASFSDETLRTVLSYLANQTIETSSQKSALERLVEQEIVPQIEHIDVIVNVDVSGGQTLPGEEVAALAATDTVVERRNLLLQLSPEVWQTVSSRLDGISEQNQSAVDALANPDLTVPTIAPALPASWQMDGFVDASDIIEMASLTRSVAAVLNEFVNNGVMRGAVSKTDDLTVDDVNQMLAIDPSLASVFEAEQFAALAPDVFAAFPNDLELDAFSRDQLAAASLARTLTGELRVSDPVALPGAWRIQPPQLITFSFADLPLATFSIFSTAAPDALVSETSTTETTDATTPTETASTEPVAQVADETIPDYPEGPALPQIFALMGEQFGFELNTADDALKLRLPAEMAGFLGGNDVAAMLNLLPQLGQFADQLAGASGTEGGLAGANFDPAQMTQFLPALQECGIGLLDLGGLSGNINFDALAEGLISCISPEVMAYIVEQEPTLPSRLSPAVYAYLKPEVLAVEGVSPTLSEEWATLGSRPEFADTPLRNADDILALGNGSAAQMLNNLNEQVPVRFEGYEVRLFDSLYPALLGYFAANEADFYSQLSPDVLLKFSPAALSALPEDVLASLDADVQNQIKAIASGEQPSAAQARADQYKTDTIPVRDDAPILNSEWQAIADFYSIELNNAYDLFRFPSVIGDAPALWMNGFFNSPQGANFMIGLMGNMPEEAFFYIANEDPDFINELAPRAVLLLPSALFDQLPENIQERAEAGEVFVPDTQVTRMNGAPSLLVTVFKDKSANTVRAYHEVADIINAIDDANDSIEVDVAFEQSSFIEDSVSGVARDGILGAFYAVVIILVFLSGGTWGRNGRFITGIAVVFVFAAVLGLLYLLTGTLEISADNDNVLFVILGGLGIVAGIAIVAYPGKLPYPEWRTTLVIGVSIPLSILSAMMLMNWLPQIVNGLLGNFSDNPVVNFILRLAPKNLTLNIMTLSGLTVAVGRLVDDSIVVLENIYRQMQLGNIQNSDKAAKREIIIKATRDVSLPVFSATLIAVVVFLPLGLTGGIISEFFLPFGLAVTYTLLSSYTMAITVVPVLAYFLISSDGMPEPEVGALERVYAPFLRTAINSFMSRAIVVVLALASVGLSVYLFSQRPAAFLPDFGEAQIAGSISLPNGTSIVETNALVEEFELVIPQVVPADKLKSVRTIVGGGGLDLSSLTGGGGVSENAADITIRLEGTEEELLAYATELNNRAATIFGDGNAEIAYGTLSSGGFGGFELVVSSLDESVDQATLESYDAEIKRVLEDLPDLEDVSSSLGDESDATSTTTYIRINGHPAISYTGVVLTEDVINFITEAVTVIQEQVQLPENVYVGQGFDSQLQTEGFSSIFVAMGIASIMIVVILVVVFRSGVYWLAVIFSIFVAPFGASIALTITDNELGISALIGLLMLLGLVTTNAIVLIDRIGLNRKERNMNLRDAILEAGERRLRPILMTALTTIIGLVPLSLGLSEGAIIASQLGVVVIGGIVSSTLLTLVVVPSAYYLLSPLHDLLTGNWKNRDK